MASCDDDFSLIPDNVTASHPHHQTSFASHHIAVSGTVVNQKRAAVAGELDADVENPAFYTPFVDEGESDPSKPASGSLCAKRSPYYYKKLKQSNNNNGCSNNGSDSMSLSSDEYHVDYRKDREEWSDAAIECLLNAYTEKFLQLNRGNLRGRDWEEVAEAVTEGCGGDGENKKQFKSYKSVEQCKNKIDNLKKRYKVEVQRVSGTGVGVSSWHWFKKIEAIVGSSVAANKGGLEEDNRFGGGLAQVTRPPKRYVLSNTAFANTTKFKSLSTPRWRRVVFKISGAALAGNCQSIDPKVAMQIAKEVTTACQLGVEVAIVVGGRNFFCGDSWVSATGLDRPTAYQIGMMATVMNSILLQSALEKLGVQTRVQSAFAVPEIVEPYSRQRAVRHLGKGRVVIFGGVGAGAGNPLFSTDTAAALRASEINADAVLKGTNINGVFSCHSGNGNVMLDNHVSFREVVSRGITSMDMMAITYCDENGISVVVFNLLEPGNISKALCGEPVGTLIDQAGRIS